MVDYNITLPQPYDPSNDIANALRFRAAQQAEAENQLKLQAWQEDRAYQQKQREAAAANAAAARARQNELLGIYGNFGLTPAAVGVRGTSVKQPEGLSSDPYETIRNELLKRGYLSQAQDLVEFKNKLATGDKTAAEIAKENALTIGANTDNAKKALDLHVAQIGEFGDSMLRASSIPEVNSLIDSHADVLKSMGITPEQAKQNFANAVDQFGFEQALMRSAKGAAVTAKHFADIALTNAQTSTARATTLKELALRDKTEWEKDHPGYELKEGANGWFAVNKQDPTDVTPIQIGGKNVMPKDSTSTVPSGYRVTADGNLEAIPGGPADLKNQNMANVKLEPGQKLDERGNIMDVPGGKPYILHSKAHAKDYQDVATLNLSTDSSFKKIDDILSPAKKSDFDNNFGYGSSATSHLPGARDVARTLESIKSGLKEAGLKVFRSGGSIGQMTEKEWPIVEQLIGSLNSDQSPEQARQTLTEIKTRMERMRNIANDTYDTQWGQTQYYKPELTSNGAASNAGGGVDANNPFLK